MEATEILNLHKLRVTNTRLLVLNFLMAQQKAFSHSVEQLHLLVEGVCKDCLSGGEGQGKRIKTTLLFCFLCGTAPAGRNLNRIDYQGIYSEPQRGDTSTLFRPAGALKPANGCNSYQDSAPLGLFPDLDFNTFALESAPNSFIIDR